MRAKYGAFTEEYYVFRFINFILLNRLSIVSRLYDHAANQLFAVVLNQLIYNESFSRFYSYYDTQSDLLNLSFTFFLYITKYKLQCRSKTFSRNLYRRAQFTMLKNITRVYPVQLKKCLAYFLTFRELCTRIV